MYTTINFMREMSATFEKKKKTKKRVVRMETDITRN